MPERHLCGSQIIPPVRGFAEPVVLGKVIGNPKNERTASTANASASRESPCQPSLVQLITRTTESKYASTGATVAGARSSDKYCINIGFNRPPPEVVTNSV